MIEAINSDEIYLELNNTKFPIFIWEGEIKKIFSLKYYVTFFFLIIIPFRNQLILNYEC